jgi:hypothetical protein
LRFNSVASAASSADSSATSCQRDDDVEMTSRPNEDAEEDYGPPLARAAIQVPLAASPSGGCLRCFGILPTEATAPAAATPCKCPPTQPHTDDPAPRPVTPFRWGQFGSRSFNLSAALTAAREHFPDIDPNKIDSYDMTLIVLAFLSHSSDDWMANCEMAIAQELDPLQEDGKERKFLFLEEQTTVTQELIKIKAAYSKQLKDQTTRWEESKQNANEVTRQAQRAKILYGANPFHNESANDAKKLVKDNVAIIGGYKTREQLAGSVQKLWTKYVKACIAAARPTKRKRAPSSKGDNGDSDVDQQQPGKKICQPTTTLSAATSKSLSKSLTAGIPLKLQLDVFIQCALHEEAIAAREIFQGYRISSARSRDPEQRSFPGCEFAFVVIPVTLTSGREIRVGIGHQSNAGLGATIQYSTSIADTLKDFGVKLWAMTGILAGIEGECDYGDAVCAFHGSMTANGKIRENGHVESAAIGIRVEHSVKILAETLMSSSQWRKHLLAFEIESADGKTPYIPRPSTSSSFKGQDARLPPPSRWCLVHLMHEIEQHESIDTLLQALRQTPYAQFFQTFLQSDKYVGVDKLINHKGDYLEVTEKGHALLRQARIQHYPNKLPSTFPYPSVPRARGGFVISTDYVREDLDKSTGMVQKLKASVAQRKLMAAEMELAAFYDTVRDCGIPFIGVKGVCDFGDTWKDDNHHGPAADISAAFLREFVEAFWEHKKAGFRTYHRAIQGEKSESGDDSSSARPASSSAAAASSSSAAREH